MKEIRFTCPLPPSVNQYLGKSVAYANGKPYVHVYETTEAKTFKKMMVKLIQRKMDEVEWVKTGEYEYVICEITAYISQKKQDTDNMFKCLMDSLTASGLIYDDSMVIPRVANIYIDSNNPRLEVKIVQAEKVGIFANESNLDIFIQRNCYNCKKYKRYGNRCAQLKASLENRITDDVDHRESLCKTNL